MPPDWPKLDPIVLHGVVGEIVNTIAPETEADPAALAIELLVRAGNAIGRGPHAVVGADVHPPRLNALIVGETSHGRKGMSRSEATRFMKAADPEWAQSAPMSGFGSGEGVIVELADPGRRGDTRLLIEEGEFARVLAVTSRDGDTLSANIRDAWDGQPLRRRIAKEKVVVSDHHVSVIAHITPDELRRRLTDTEAANGFANRFLYILARRSQLLPEGGSLDPLAVETLGGKLHRRIQSARTAGRRGRSEAAREMWADLYGRFDRDAAGGLAGAVTARADAQVLRLSLLFSLLDGAPAIEVDHLAAAWHLWRYADASARYIFGDSTGDPAVDRLLEALAEAEPGGLDAVEMKQAIGRNYLAVRERAERLGKVVTVTEETGGRPRLVSHLTA
jgi:Protein of unknown function (DUF3987)